MIELLNNAYSTCSQKVRLCLHEKQLEFRDTQLDFRKNEHLAPEYLALNPNGVVPTLVHDGQPIVDSSVIMEYLEEVFPQVPLSPATPVTRADMRAWLRFFEEVPTAAIRVPSFSTIFVRHFADLDDDAFDAAAKARPLRTHFYQKMGRTGFSDDEVDASFKALSQTIERMQKRLAGNAWLCGERLTLADLCVYPSFDRMADLGHASMWADAPDVDRWFEALRARPSYPATYYQGSRLSHRYPELQEVST
ncbi:glutathione S-transferase family protein [Mesorhizobium sp. CAU 1741]|uniref:glutathione S-transferase family protein n=1 Tax=Mesorhizobium sp. CAU 1741 TaxID=3140366 RepID=UPI00325BD1C9